jgi:hypothetical protein
MKGGEMLNGSEMFDGERRNDAPSVDAQFVNNLVTDSCARAGK